jgi:F0F1-type ATP synthase membrane subunit b/b'
MLERAKRELGLARDDAIKALYQQSIELASQMAGKIVKKQLQPGDHQALLDESLKEIAGIRR